LIITGAYKLSLKLPEHPLTPHESTGNVQVSPQHLGTPFDVVVPSPSSSFTDSAARKAAFASWARALRSPPSSSSPPGAPPPPRTVNILQLNHPGRQSLRFFHGRSYSTPSLAPSAVPLSAGNGACGRLLGQALWGTPRAMNERDIEEVVESFVQGARVAKETGWDGVELHASHGYLLAQYMSPKVRCVFPLSRPLFLPRGERLGLSSIFVVQVNLRTDEYGGSARKRLALLLRIIDAIRAELPQSSGFCLGVKLNCSDYVVRPVSPLPPLPLWNANVLFRLQKGGLTVLFLFLLLESFPLADISPSTGTRRTRQRQVAR
jgi:hypothetical protein